MIDYKKYGIGDHSRILKAWDISTEQMLSPICIDGAIKFFGKNKDNPSMVFYRDYLDPEILHLKPTGLKDKNGKEIFEGDIVKHGNGVQVVQYLPQWASFQVWLSNHVLDQETEGYGDMELLGNIFENPELLE